MRRMVLSAFATLLIVSAAFAETPDDRVWCECARIAAKKAEGTRALCGSVAVDFGYIRASANAAQTVLDAIRNETSACLEKNGGRKLSQAEAGTSNVDFYDFGGKLRVYFDKNWNPDRSDPSRQILWIRSSSQAR